MRDALKAATVSPPKQRLRVWLRLLKLSRGMENRLREKLRTEFGTTLPRFDVMAALDRHQKGLKMSELSSVLKVSNGNITGIVDRLVADHCIVRVPVAGDRRAWQVQLTRKGREEFAEMAAAHETWVDAMLGELGPKEADDMIVLLDRLSETTGDRQ
ncbi:MAG: MarR family transcriptional regulator [Rhizobiales bacterium]|nr:MarR family transcriptional regulator [Hyphomicrobiales bacterium]